jgi:aspartyl-tRNA(Asn)/glutamyl-tRNA(Gln) amidotransferase subunit A
LAAIDTDRAGVLHEVDARAIADDVRAGRRRARGVLEHFLDRIDRLNGDLNAFVFVDAERARAVADDVDARVAAGEDPGLLAGVPLGIKELESVEGWPATQASTVFEDRVADYTTTMTTRLLGAGAVPVGLTASPEIGHLPYTCSVLHGPTRNPWDRDRTPGGSSGGAGSALAAGLIPLATGSDSGGSIRLPAGWSGVVGVKGTLGRIPRGPGFVGFANITHYGPLARSVRDAARFIDVAVGVDNRDQTSLPAPPVPYEQALESTSVRGLRVAVVDDNGLSPSDPGVRAALRAAADALIAAAGLHEVEVTMTLPDLTVGAAAVVLQDTDQATMDVMPQIMANLFATDGAEPLMTMAYGGVDMSIEGVLAGVQSRHGINSAMADLFDQIDLLLTPCSPVPAFGCGGPLPTVVDGREVGPAAAALFTSPFNMSGHPVVSVPMGIVDGCPVGMQIVAARHADVLALAAAAVFEASRPWPKLAPDYRGG